MKYLAALLAALLASPTAAAWAEERITDFYSRIVVAPSGELTVTERIDVLSEGKDIRHGVYRDFPTTYTMRDGFSVRVGFKVVSVSRDEHPEPFSVSAIEGGERVKIGSPNIWIDPGEHRYKLTYQTDRQIGFFADCDELYWNATGNFWRFPIERAEATVVLPDAAKILQFAAYTGAAGSTARNARGDKISDNEITFHTTAPLGRNEGLTVSVGFDKGVVAPPTATDRADSFLRDNAHTLAAPVGALALLAYFVVVWRTLARRPKHGVIIPLYEPPRDFSPGAVRFVRDMAYDRKAYAASLIDMAVKGYLKIVEDAGQYTLTRTGKGESETGLAHGETAIAKRLFAGDNSVDVSQINHDAIGKSVSALKASLAGEYERSYFVTNRGWFLGGLVILTATAIAAALFQNQPFPAALILVWLSGWTIGTAFLLHRVWDAWTTARYGPGLREDNVIHALFLSVCAIPFLIGWIFGVISLTGAIGLPSLLALDAGGLAAYIFYDLLKAPTLAGRKVLDRIEGFRMFLTTAEKDRLEALSPPSMTPEVFDRFLPYAIALDCENEWSRRFESEAAAAEAGDGGRLDGRGGGYSPQWYSGSSSFADSVSDFAGGLGEFLAASAGEAATAPGSSSGSGGGGSSGGGGGGGGGGGW